MQAKQTPPHTEWNQRINQSIGRGASEVGLVSRLRQNVRSLFSPHHRDTGVRPHEEESGRVRPAAHAVVARPVASADDAGYLGHIRAGYRRHELGTVLGDSLVLVPLPHLFSGGTYRSRMIQL